MKIFTSYHKKALELLEMGLTPISISVQFPKYAKIKYHQYKVLAPRYDMLKMDKNQYGEEFQKILSKLNPVHIHSDLVKLSKGKDIVLLCYEKDLNDCHRKKVGEWLEKKLQVKVEEIMFKQEKKKIEKGINQLGLFG